MIIVQDERRYALYCRTNRHVKWQFAQYAGRFCTIEEGIENIKQHLPGQSFQYLAQDTETGKETIGTAAP